VSIIAPKTTVTLRSRDIFTETFASILSASHEIRIVPVYTPLLHFSQLYVQNRTNWRWNRSHRPIQKKHGNNNG